MSAETESPFQAAYNRECALIGEAYAIITEQKAILKAATKRRNDLLAQAAAHVAKTAGADAKKESETKNDGK